MISPPRSRVRGSIPGMPPCDGVTSSKPAIRGACRFPVANSLAQVLLIQLPGARSADFSGSKRRSFVLFAMRSLPVGGFSMIGNTLSHHRIIEKLGQGGNAEIYRAQERDRRTGRLFPGSIVPDRLEDSFSPWRGSPGLPAPIANPRQSLGAGKDRQCRSRECPDFR